MRLRSSLGVYDLMKETGMCKLAVAILILGSLLTGCIGFGYPEGRGGGGDHYYHHHDWR
jgi:hypothetical protein